MCHLLSSVCACESAGVWHLTARAQRCVVVCVCVLVKELVSEF
jgi:hypothetical protein